MPARLNVVSLSFLALSFSLSCREGWVKDDGKEAIQDFTEIFPAMAGVELYTEESYHHSERTAYVTVFVLSGQYPALSIQEIDADLRKFGLVSTEYGWVRTIHSSPQSEFVTSEVLRFCICSTGTLSVSSVQYSVSSTEDALKLNEFTIEWLLNEVWPMQESLCEATVNRGD